MNKIVKYGATVALAGACAFAMATPSQARWHGHHYRHSGAAAAIGFDAGVLAGAAVANQGYYYEPDYAYAPGPYYAYEPAYPTYAYEPAPAYAYNSRGCWHVTDSARGFGYWGACTSGSKFVR